MKKKYGRKTGLLVCIPCFALAAVCLCWCLAEQPPVPYAAAGAGLTFSLTFGLIAALNTDWK